MAKAGLNERKTERLVSQHFDNDPYKEVLIEMQKSDVPKINKLLKFASKKGGGIGCPEFIITFKKVPNFLIVVECKADVSKHQSKALDKYADFAVDGALLYSSFLSKEYDVLVIAASGQSKSEMKVSHLLQLKGEVAAPVDYGNKLLNLENYLKNYLESPQKYKQDYYSLIAYCRTLNNKLHNYKILANQRGLLLSSILIALDNKAFRNSYKDIEEPQVLADRLVDTVVVELSKTLAQKKVENLNHQFSFIRSDATLSLQKNPLTGQNVLAELIDDISQNVREGYFETLKYFDVIGQLYVEFLSYANADSALGIVLTPPHITQLFSDLAFVNMDSIVYDNCTGTAGFLISAMRAMVLDAKKDDHKIKHIKEHQLIGVEYQSHIYALAATNMYIHKDGKSNIIQGDCFDADIMATIKEYRPTVGMLNPPYPNDKVNGINEFEFVLNNLECLQPGGLCVAIIPMERVLSAKKNTVELKKRLLEKHTLEAVMSMPDDLFYNTDNGVVTAIVVFRAHIPHSPRRETYFGYWKDDGFEKRKHKGRIDAYDKWESIKETWLKSYENPKNIPGLCVTKAVKATDEWCAEAYMQTDYNALTKDDFLKTMKEYVLFKELFLK